MSGIRAACVLTLLPTLLLSQGRSASTGGFGTTPGAVTVAERKGYRAAFDSAGVTFSNAESSLRLELVSVGRRSGTATLPALDGTRWVGESLRYERGSLIETYELRDAGVKQSFLFEALPAGSGDLVVRVRIRSRAPLTSATEDEVYFAEAGANGIRIEEVTGIDADGNRITGTLTWQYGELALVLPAAFVDQAALPLLVDPLIGEGSRIATTAINSTFRPRQVDVAYLPGADRYYAIWLDERDLNLGPSVKGRLLDPDGRPAGRAKKFTTNIFGLTNPVFAFEAQVSAVRGSQSFVVVMIGGLFTSENAHMTVVDARGSFPLPMLIEPDINSIDVGGNAAPHATHAVVVYAEGNAIHFQKIDTLTRETVATSSIGLGTDLATFVSISRTEGGVGRYLVVWDLFNARDVQGAIVDDDLNVLVPPFPLADSPDREQRPDVDGDGHQWLVAFERQPALFDRDIHRRSVRFDPSTGSVQLGPVQALEADAGQDESAPSVAWLGESYLVGFSEDVDDDGDVFVTSLDGRGQSLCEGKLSVFAQGTDDAYVAIASERSSGVWEVRP